MQFALFLWVLLRSTRAGRPQPAIADIAGEIDQLIPRVQLPRALLEIGTQEIQRIAEMKVDQLERELAELFNAQNKGRERTEIPATYLKVTVTKP
jgi:hypothetical protein